MQHWSTVQGGAGGLMTDSSLLESTVGDHIVHFYDDEFALVQTLAKYLRGTLLAGGAGVAIATSERLREVRAALAAAGEDVIAAEADGRLVLRDADETLSLFEADGVLDAVKFERVISEVLRSAAAGGRDVRVYGEMVARLWDRGLVPAAIDLERLWNELGTRFPFVLLCGYPAGIVNDPESAQSFTDVCACHTSVLDGAPELTAEMTRRFPSEPHAARLARRLVLTCLEQWGYGHLADDALLVVGELTANAVTHGGLDFTCGVSRVRDRVRIEVGDGTSAIPVVRALDEQAVHGRGLHLVGALVHSWGWISAPPGKVVWAELVNEAPVRSAG